MKCLDSSSSCRRLNFFFLGAVPSLCMTTQLIGLPEEPLGLLFIMQGLFCSHYPNVCSLHAAITVPGKTVVHGNWSMKRMK